ncbi:MAG: GntR family transcriptional regulator [Caryophanon sp.]|nr:GntR family transcriptional regulator [Caryophanon sp.]
MTTEQQPKRFVELVTQLRHIIDEDRIQPGDKLPSERVLAERLSVSRSAVREALRSLELLGLIETRHGGGTFLAAFQQHQLVEVLSMFILQTNQQHEDVLATKKMHEREAILLITSSKQLRALPVWDSYFQQLELEGSIERLQFIQELIVTSGNRLSLKIWRQLVAYSNEQYTRTSADEKRPIQMLLKAMQLGYTVEATAAYNEWGDVRFH